MHHLMSVRHGKRTMWLGSNLRETFKSRHLRLDLGTDIPAWSAISQIKIYRLEHRFRFGMSSRKLPRKNIIV